MQAFGDQHGGGICCSFPLQVWFTLGPLLLVAVMMARMAHSKHLERLRRADSSLLWLLYGLCWGFMGLAIALAVMNWATAGHGVLWNLSSIMWTWATNTIEIAIIMLFVFHGHFTTSHQALLKTLSSSSLISGVPTLLQALVVFVFRAPLFDYRCVAHPNSIAPPPSSALASLHRLGRDDMLAASPWSQWGWRVPGHLAAAIVYLGLTLAPYTPFRELLPAKRTLSLYVSTLCAVYVLRSVGSILAGSGFVAGQCIWGVAGWLYQTGYAGLLLVTLLWDVLQGRMGGDGLDSDLLMYAEMRDAGVFDDSF